MKHFTDKELRCKCCGRLPPEAKENLKALVDNVLDPVRELYGSPVYVNSGFRCPLHNAAVGGVAKSQHLTGEAADITAGSPAGNLKLARLIAQLGNYDQMILYVHSGSMEPQFLHVSWKRCGNNRHCILKQVLGTSGYSTVTSLYPTRTQKTKP